MKDAIKTTKVVLAREVPSFSLIKRTITSVRARFEVSAAKTTSKKNKEAKKPPPVISENAALYHGETPATHPLVSPLFGDLKNLPPLLIQVGTDEILWDDACSFAEKAKMAGNDCTLELYENMPHVFQLGADFVPEAKVAVKKITEFVNAKIK